MSVWVVFRLREGERDLQCVHETHSTAKACALRRCAMAAGEAGIEVVVIPGEVPWELDEHGEVYYSTISGAGFRIEEQPMQTGPHGTGVHGDSIAETPFIPSCPRCGNPAADHARVSDTMFGYGRRYFMCPEGAQR